jgi:hypothetical protein
MSKSICSHRRGISCLLGPLVALVTGCGAGTGDVTGTVSYQGKPVASGTVLIVGADSLPYYGSIQEDGTYTVPNVPLGLGKIAISCPQRVSAKGAEFAKRRSDPKKWFPLPEKYRDFAASGLTVNVAAGETMQDLELVDER